MTAGSWCTVIRLPCGLELSTLMFMPPELETVVTEGEEEMALE